MNSKCLLATLASDHADDRIQVVLDRTVAGDSIISLVQQSWSESLGWYTQQAMNLSPEQVAQLRAALGASTARQATSQPSPDRAAVIGPLRAVCVPFPSPTRRAHSA